jgi:hypothetical protein
MKKLLLISLLFFSCIRSFAQLENANWHFGRSTGLTFNTTPPSVISSQLGSFPHHGYSGCSSSVSDASGHVLFYTDGVYVWDKNHNQMTNGYDLYGAVSQYEGKQNSVIVPKPGNSDIYYIFTISYFEPGWSTIGHGGLHYSVVDMRERSHLGDVVLKNIPLTSHDNLALDYDYSTATGLQIYQTKITTTLSATGNKIWLSFFPYFYQGGVSSLYSYSYAITENGICGQADGSSPAPTSFDLLNNANYDPWPYMTAGCIKISPDGHHLAEIADHHVNLYDFNNATGHVTFNQTLYDVLSPSDPYPQYGIEFSPNSQLVYFSTVDGVDQSDFHSFGGNESRAKYARIFQCPVGKGEKKQIGAFRIDTTGVNNNVITPLPALFPMGMQLGIDNKIYVCTHELIGGNYYQKWLGVIQDPDQYLTPTFVAQSIDLDPYSHWGSLPQWVHTAKIDWPKVYDGLEPGECVKTDDHGNVLARINLHNMGNNINHNGPVVPNTLYDFWMQYNKSDGATNWVAQESYFQNFTMSSGDLHLSQGAQSMSTNKYRNATTGTVISGPSYVPTSDLIVAEDNGIYITSHLDNNTPVDELVVNASPSTHNAVAMPTLSGYWVGTGRIIFNPATDNLFVNYTFHPFIGSPERNFLAVYHLDNTTYTLSSTPLYYRELTDPLAEVNSQEQAFVFHSGVIKKYDYVNDVYTTLAVSNNSSLYTFRTLKQTVEDNIVAINFTDSKIYCFNTNPLVMTTRKLSASLGSDNIDPYIGCYHVDGDYVYLAGGFSGSSFTIGNQISTQTMPLLGSMSSFITRFHIIEDFNRSIGLSTGFFAKPAEPAPQEKPAFSAALFPNPAKNMLEVRLTESDAKAIWSYTIDIVNIYGTPLLRKKAQQNRESINISTLKTGVYYVVITNIKGEKIKKAFLKE